MITDKEYLNKELQICKKTIDEAKLPTWDELPKLELYMDQVVMLLNEYLGYISEMNPDEKTVTSSMINNYVKMKIIPAPNKKKYSRIHLSRLIILCSLKKSLSISTVFKLLPESEDEKENQKVYDAFVKSRREAINNNLILLEREFRAVLNSDDITQIGDMITRMAVVTDLHKMFTEKFAGIVFENKQPEKSEKSEKIKEKSEKKAEKTDKNKEKSDKNKEKNKK